jgi:peptidyl-prolyl cis-trans isomerase D
MLQTIRDKITGWVAGIFLAVIAIVFIFWGIDFRTAAVTYAAKVDGERISAEEVRRVWQQQQSRLQQMLRAELPDELVRSQQSAILDQFVRQSLLRQRAEDVGLRVSDEALAQRIIEMPEFQVDGRFSKDRYNALLRGAGLSEARFESDLRTQLLIEQLQNGVIDSAFVVPYELDRRFALERQRREVDYALVAANDFLSTITLTDEDIEKFYEEYKDEYMLPEKVDLEYLELKRDRAAGAVEVSEEALRQYYEQIKEERYLAPEQRRARHILITASDGLDDAAAEKLAADLVAKIQGGADFAQLAKQHSKDPGSAAQGGDLGWAERGMFVGPFEEALFAMSPGEVRGPVKTPFGYHIIKLEEVEAGHVRSFEEVRAELEAEYRKERSESLFYEQTQKLGDLAFEALTELESVARTLDLPLKTVTGFTREGSEELPANREIIEAAFSPEVLEEGQNSPLIAVDDDTAMVLRVTNHVPAEPKPLADVREEIVARLKTQRAREAAAAKGAEALERLKNGESWEEALAAVGLKPVGGRLIDRQDGIAPTAVVSAAFSVPVRDISAEKPYVGGTTTVDGNYAVYRVTEVQDADPADEVPDARSTRQRIAERQLGNEEFAAYLQEAGRKADIVKNERVFD